jgi:hypothetical protein
LLARHAEDVKVKVVKAGRLERWVGKISCVLFPHCRDNYQALLFAAKK